MHDVDLQNGRLLALVVQKASRERQAELIARLGAIISHGGGESPEALWARINNDGLWAASETREG